jgi:pyridinium-3,5-biscarboxylic acid mononucleotide sulfurtransferase
LTGADMQDYQRLISNIAALGSAAVALSGGADSSLLARAAQEALGNKAAAFTLDTRFMPRREVKQAQEAARWAGIRHVLVQSDPLENPLIRANDDLRCYHCKKALFNRLKADAAAMGLLHVMDGTNADDEPAGRPGMKALEELGVISPLRDAGIGKQHAREISRLMGSPSWNKHAYSCLATKVVKGAPIDAEQLNLAEAAEEALIRAGIEGFKVRLLAKGIGIETQRGMAAEHKETSRAALERLGFSRIEFIQLTGTD